MSDTKPNASQKYLALVAQKISRENRDQFPTPESVSDYKIHHELGISQSRMSSYSRGRTQFDEDMCCRVGQYLGITEVFVVLDVLGDKTKSPEAAKIIKKQAKVIKVDFANRAKAMAVSSMIALAGLVTPMENAEASPFPVFWSSLQCILCKIAREPLERLRRFKRRFKSCSKHPAHSFAYLSL